MGLTMSKASEFLRDFLLIIPDCYRHSTVGQVVLKMSPAKRQLLSELKSEDIENIRPSTIWGPVCRKGRGRWGTRI